MLFLHAKCDLQTHKCDFDTHTVIFNTYENVFHPYKYYSYTQSVIYGHAKCDFHTHSVIFKLKSVISTLTIVNTTRKGVIYRTTSVISTRCV
jgi:hypothetical protein